MMTLKQIAELLDGTVIGDSSIEIFGVETIEGARSGDLTFAVDQKNIDKLTSTAASAVLIPNDVQECPVAAIRCDEVQSAFTRIAETLRPALQRSGIGVSPNAFVSPTAILGQNVNIYPGAFVGDGTTIGDDTTIYPGVCILENCEIGCDVSIFPNAVLYESSKVGDRSIIHANAVIGAYGFGYDSGPAGHKLSVQLGSVELSEDVEIGACTTIDRGTFGTTRIGTGSKLDNQVMIGHNCQIGSHNLLCSQVGIAGSCQTGSFVVMAGQVGIGDHLTIGEEAILFAKSGVMHNLEGGQTYMGAPATLARERFQVFAAQTRLPEMRKQFKKLVRRVEKLESESAADDSPTARKAA